MTAIEAACGLIAGATSIAALNGELFAWVSLVASTASTSTRPIREKPATMPGVTQRPVASKSVGAGRDRDIGAGGDDAAVADDDGAAVDRRRPVADHDAAAGDRDGLRGGGRGERSAAMQATRS